MTMHSTTLMQASHQWASRPSDQRFLSLTEMLDFKNRVKANSQAKVLSSRAIEVQAVEGDMRGLQVLGANGGGPINPTNWAFGQMASLVGAPAKYLRALPSVLAADCLNYGLLRREVEDVGIMMMNGEGGTPGELACVTGPNYGRIHDANIVAQLVNRFGDGVTGDFKVPGEFGKDVPITRQNTTLYASDRDMFVFLADEKNRIEVADRRNGQPGQLARGFFVWNSEVGSKTFGVATFLFDYVCMNRIVWGAAEYRELTIRHTASAPDKFIEEVAPALEAYGQSSTASITTAIEAAKKARLDADVQDFLAKRMNRALSIKQMAAVVATHEAEEGRPIETVWDAVTGVTAYARQIQHQDTRVDVERAAGKLLDLVS